MTVINDNCLFLQTRVCFLEIQEKIIIKKTTLWHNIVKYENYHFILVASKASND